MIKQLLAVSALAVVVSTSALAGGGFEPSPTIMERPSTETPETMPAVVAAPFVVAPVEVREHAMFLGTYGLKGDSVTEVDLDDLDTSDVGDVFDNVGDREYDRAGYVKYSPVVSGISPVATVAFGDLKGFGLGLGYGFVNKVKLYATINTYDGDDYFTSDALIGGEAGLNVALPVGLALDLGVATPELDEIGNSEGEAIPFIGAGYRW